MGAPRWAWEGRGHGAGRVQTDLRNEECCACDWIGGADAAGPATRREAYFDERRNTIAKGDPEVAGGTGCRGGRRGIRVVLPSIWDQSAGVRDAAAHCACRGRGR